MRATRAASCLPYRDPSRPASSTAQIPIAALEKLVEARTLNDSLFGVALSHHWPATASNGKVETIRNWRETAKHIQNTAVQLLVHRHGHKRCADFVSLSGEPPREAKGRMSKTEILRVMAPTTHLDDKLRPPQESRGFNIITLTRHNGRVESVEVDSYELGADVPHRAADAP